MESWKYGKYENYGIEKFQRHWKYGNFENMEDVNRNKRVYNGILLQGKIQKNCRNRVFGKIFYLIINVSKPVPFFLISVNF